MGCDLVKVKTTFVPCDRVSVGKERCSLHGFAFRVMETVMWLDGIRYRFSPKER
jgi:hypothetical protein